MVHVRKPIPGTAWQVAPPGTKQRPLEALKLAVLDARDGDDLDEAMDAMTRAGCPFEEVLSCLAMRDASARPNPEEN